MANEKLIRSPLFAFRKAPKQGRYRIIAGLSILGSIAFWQISSQMRWMPEDFFPSPVRVVNTAVKMILNDGFLRDVFASAARIYIAFFISALVAVPLGLLMSSFKFVEAVLEPLIDFVRYIPVPALAPIFILWTGIGEAPKFLILFFGTFFQLVLLVMDDADNVPAEYFDNGRMLGASLFGLFRDILLPAILPQTYDRLRVTLGWCWTYLIIAELLAVQRGVGHVLKEAQRFNAPDQMFVCFLTLGFIGLASDYSAKAGYSRLFPYAAKARLTH